MVQIVYVHTVGTCKMTVYIMFTKKTQIEYMSFETTGKIDNNKTKQLISENIS